MCTFLFAMFFLSRAVRSAQKVSRSRPYTIVLPSIGTEFGGCFGAAPKREGCGTGKANGSARPTVLLLLSVTEALCGHCKRFRLLLTLIWILRLHIESSLVVEGCAKKYSIWTRRITRTGDSIIVYLFRNKTLKIEKSSTKIRLRLCNISFWINKNVFIFIFSGTNSLYSLFIRVI